MKGQGRPQHGLDVCLCMDEKAIGIEEAKVNMYDVPLTSQSLVGRVLKEQEEYRGPTPLLHLDRVESCERPAVERLTLYLNRSLQKKIRHQSRPKFNDATV